MIRGCSFAACLLATLAVTGCSQSEPADQTVDAGQSPAPAVIHEGTSAPLPQAAQVAAAPVDPSTVIAKTPEEAVEIFATALQSGDFQKLEAIYAQPFAPLLVEWNLAPELRQTQLTLVQAVLDHFGQEAEYLSVAANSDLSSQLKRLKKMTVHQKQEAGEGYTLMVKTEMERPDGGGTFEHVEPVSAIQQNGGWRLCPPIVQEQGLAWLEEQLDMRRDVGQKLQLITADVKSGKYDSVISVEQAVYNVIGPTGPPEQVASEPQETLQR